MDDLISREMAIGVVGRRCGMCIQGILDIPSAQTEIEERKGKSAQNVPKEDLISRKAAIEALDSINCCGYVEEPWDIVRGIIERVPAAEPEKRTEERTETHGVCLDVIDRQATLDWLKNEWNGMITSLFDGIKALPSAQTEIIRCGQCKYAEVADKEDAQDGYTCQFHRGSVWFSGSYCSWAERRTDE